MRSYADMTSGLENLIAYDYAGMPEKSEFEPPDRLHGSQTLEMRNDHTNDLAFLLAARRYLNSFADRHLKISTSNRRPHDDWSLGFTVRATEDALYITSVSDARDLKIGDRIVSLGDETIPQVRASMAQSRLYGTTPERELWEDVIKGRSRLEVQSGDGSSRRYLIEHYPENRKPPKQELHRLHGDVILLTLGNLDSRTTLTDILQLYGPDISNASSLIIDVRNCLGGTTEGFFPLLAYVCDEKIHLHDLVEDAPFDTDPLLISYTAGNCTRQQQVLKLTRRLAIESGKSTEELLSYLDRLIDEYERKSGEGLLEEKMSKWEALDFEIEPKGSPKRIVVLTDLFTGDAAEEFVGICRGLDNIIVMGRNTLGNLDYAVPITAELGEGFFVTYPTGKTKSAQAGKGMSRIGIAPDTYIPWSPKDCMTDVLLESAKVL